MKLTLKAVSVTTFTGSKPYDNVLFSIENDGVECGTAAINCAEGEVKEGDKFDVKPGKKLLEGATKD